MCEIGLTAVIPIRRLDESVSKLKGSILQALQLGIEVILVIDCQEESERLQTMKHFRSIGHNSFKIEESNKETPGEARNIGIALSERPYVTFWDADDIPVIAEVVEMLNRLSAEPNKKYGIGSYEVIECATAKVLSSQLLMEQTTSLEKLFINPGIWRWIFLKENFQDVKFQKFRMGEDQDFIADLNPNLDEIVFSSLITYKYVKGWSNQLTNNQSAVNDLSQSIHYLAQKVLNGKANVWHRKFLFRQILTALKRGSIRVKFQAIVSAARIVQNHVK